MMYCSAYSIRVFFTHIRLSERQNWRLTMKRVGILTFQNANNYGAVLQAYAICKYLNSIDDSISAEVINYISSAIEKRNPQLPLAHGSKQSVKSRLKGLINYKNIHKGRKIFKEFRKSCLSLTKSVSRDQLTDIASQYDIIICVSDQIWNLEITGFDTSYFLDFAGTQQMICSYAASMGNASIIDRYEDRYRDLLSRFSVISVREKSTQKALEQLLGRSVRVDIDPVFLLDRKSWSEVTEYSHRDPYILVFKMGTHKSGEMIIPFAKEIAKKKNLQLLYMTDREVWYNNRDIDHLGVATPSQFLGLIQGADTVVTNSFHATALSLMFNTEFFVNTDIPRAERITDLLNTTGLDDRTLQFFNCHSNQKDIDWNFVNQALENVINNSRTYLNGICK